MFQQVQKSKKDSGRQRQNRRKKKVKSHPFAYAFVAKHISKAF